MEQDAHGRDHGELSLFKVIRYNSELLCLTVNRQGWRRETRLMRRATRYR